MKILADENFPGLAAQLLRQSGHDVLWIKTEFPGLPDSEVFEKARDEHRLLITLDKDFGELAFRQKRSLNSGIVLFRLPLLSPASTADLIHRALSGRDDWPGHFSVIEPGRIRMIKLP